MRLADPSSTAHRSVGEAGPGLLAPPGKGLVAPGTLLLLLHLRAFTCGMNTTLRRELRDQICELGGTTYFMELVNGMQVLLI